jgi:hypothetical protein
MSTPSDLTTIVPLNHAKLEHDESHLSSVILNQVKKQKMFLIAGPTAYAFNQIRYYGHLTDRRLILEIYPYNNLENLVIKATLALGKKFAPGTAFGAKMSMNKANTVMRDPEGNWISLPYNLISVDFVKSLGIAKFLRIQMSVSEVELYFQVGPVDSKLIARKDFIDDFLAFIQGLIKKSKKKASA